MATLSRMIKCLDLCMKLTALAAILFLPTMYSYAQKLATLEINLDRTSAGLEIPVQVMLDPITHLPDSSLSLLEIQGKEKIPVVFQLEGGPHRKLTWLVDDKLKTRVYELVKARPAAANPPSLKTVKDFGAITIQAENKNLLRYHSQPVYPPKGIDPVFKRSAFIHPLWSPHGQELTRIHAPDHYHHFGLWNPWTHVLFEGDTVDFWNLKSKQGTVRFADFISTTNGNIFAEFSALQEHVAFKEGKEKVALQEVQTVRIYAPRNNSDYYIADITAQLNCPGSPVRLLEYRYGGMGWRATEQWTKENSKVLSSEGKTRKDADGSKARWCIVQGTVDGENAGAVMMSYPANYNHPEPLRIWPENANRNRGDMFANFSPTKDMDWPLEPGKNYILKYRFVVFNGEFTKEKAEAAWYYFASPPMVTVKKNAN
ncbi:MAG: PmoA family protein [Cyclobacteriaceae bacterium]